MPTAVIVLKAKGTRPAETLRLPGVELRHEPERRRVVVHQNGSDIACIDLSLRAGAHAADPESVAVIPCGRAQANMNSRRRR